MANTSAMEPMATTVSLDEETKEMLQHLGRKGETYDEIIRRLIEEAGWANLDDRWNEILESDEFISLDELWTVALDVLVSRTFQRFFDDLDETVQDRLRTALEALEEDPYEPRSGADIKRLSKTDPVKHRVRVGDWRIVYRVVEDERVVKVIEGFRRGAGIDERPGSTLTQDQGEKTPGIDLDPATDPAPREPRPAASSISSCHRAPCAAVGNHTAKTRRRGAVDLGPRVDGFRAGGGGVSRGRVTPRR